ncbi:hypothetical protein [Fibrella aestuarina]|uniref:hypothetical protein n=1 Tax=Fibrella aestuarina TaxID=651143 RepID=UPI0011D2BA9A|nr:hypothetical protein [Fibrella aestuarina]
MQQYHLLNYPLVGRRLLTYYLQRTGWLCEGSVGTFSEAMLESVLGNRDAILFLHLPDPDDNDLPGSFRDALCQHPAVIVTSPYPAHLFNWLPFRPFAFMTEPFSYDQFAACLEKYVAVFG